MGRASNTSETAALPRRSPLDGVDVGARLRIEKSKDASLYRRNDICTVVACLDDGYEVIFDSGLKTTLGSGDRFMIITDLEAAERAKALAAARVSADGRVELTKEPKTWRTRGVVRRGWRGTILAVDDQTQLVRVKFDRGPEVEVDPRIELLKGIGYAELVARRQKAVAKHKLATGVVIELTADVEGEALLRKGLRGTVRAVAPDGMVYMRWQTLEDRLNPHLDPANDEYRIYDSGSSGL